MDKPNWILLVEGEKGANESLKALLLEAGYKVLTCAESARSHQFLLNQKFACVLVDHDLKGVAGVSVISPIKRNPYHLNHQTPFILISTALDPDVLRKVALHIEAAFVKPVSDQMLMDKVEALLRSKAA